LVGRESSIISMTPTARAGNLKSSLVRCKIEKVLLFLCRENFSILK
jgi:hypothetical protein